MKPLFPRVSPLLMGTAVAAAVIGGATLMGQGAGCSPPPPSSFGCCKNGGYLQSLTNPFYSGFRAGCSYGGGEPALCWVTNCKRTSGTMSCPPSWAYGSLGYQDWCGLGAYKPCPCSD